MSVLPLNWPDKVDSPELVAWLQQFGLDKYIDSSQINSIRDALNELHARTADTRIVENTGLQIVGTDVVINELWKWLILSVLYSNDSQITLPITLSSEGNQKLCYLCANEDNGFELVYGPESETNPVAPTIPDNLLYITFFLVTDGTVGTPAESIVGDAYKKKSESLGYGDPYLTGANAVIQLRPEGISRYAFSNSELVSIDGFGLDLISGNPDAEAPYPGKDLFIENTGVTPFSLLHQGSGDANSKFFFLNETDLVVPVGGKVWLKYGVSDCEVIFKSWNDIDLSNKADLVGGKVPASQLPAYVDDVLEFANLAGFPATGESGKIYLALDTNFTYRWSGSTYVQLGGGKSKFIVKDFLVATNLTTTWRFRAYASATSYTPTVLDSGTSTFLTALTGSGASSIPYQTHNTFVAPFDVKLKSIEVFKTDVFSGETFSLGIGMHLKTDNSSTVTDGVSILEVTLTKGSYSSLKKKYTSADFGDVTLLAGHSIVVGWINQGRGIELYFEFEEV